MARKRKARVVEAPSEPETAQPIDPEPEPEPEQPQAEESVQTLAENPGVEEETVDGEKEEQMTETEVGEGEGEEEGKGEEEEEYTSDTEHKDNVIAADTEEQKDDVIAADTEEHKDDVIAADTEEHKDDVIAADTEKAEQDAELTEIPSEKSVSENGGGAEEQDGEGEDELGDEPLEKLLEPFSKDQLTLLIKEAVAKHPDVIENVHKLADSDPAHCKIFVHGLGWDANSEMITSVFGKYGEIEDCKVVKDKNTGKSKGYGFILYKHRNGARRVLKEPQKMINGRMTSCQLASAGPIQTPPPVAVSSVPNPNMSEFTQRKIYVSNVSADIDPNKLLEFFSKFGEIEEGPLGLDKQTGKPRGFCLFVYKSVDSSKKALEEPHKNFEGHMLHCQKAIDGPKHSKSHINQQLGQPQQQQHHHHNQGHQGYYHNPAKKAKYSGSSGVGYAGGHLMAPSAGPTVPSVGFSPAAAPAAIGQAVAALLASQGGGLGMGNLLGGIGAGMNPQGMPPIMSNVGYGGQVSAGGYGGQPAMQGGYGGQPQMGQGGVRPHQGGAPYMGRGR